MAIDAIGSVAAYARLGALAGRTAAPPAAALPSPDEGVTGGFGAMVGNTAQTAITAMQAADGATAAQLAGRGDMIDLVTAIGAAETALDTMVAVRDRMVNAYGEIMRMQI